MVHGEAGEERGPPPSPAVELVRSTTRNIHRALLARHENVADDAPFLIQDLEAYRSCLEALLDGEDPASAALRLPGSASPLAELYQSRLLSGDVDAEDTTVLSVLRAVARLRTEARIDRCDDPDPDLKAWFARPDAFELLVEVAHDLRSPLTSILFLSEVVRSGQSGELNEVQRSQMGLIYSAALGLTSITSNVVELAKDERSLVDAEDATLFSVGEVLRSVTRMVRPMAEEKQVELRVSNRNDDRLHGHPAALSRILLNLATNSLKFTERGHVEIGVTRLSHHTLRFHVEDTGRGIPETQLEQLFQPFRRRAKDNEHFFSGSGLGLSICQRLLNAMGSSLEVETTLGEGSRFFFSLESTPSS